MTGEVPERCRLRFGVVQEAVSWRLTLWGWLLLLATLLFSGYFACLYAHAFLDVERRVDSDVIVVPGMLVDSVLLEVAKELQRDPGLEVVTLGGPISRGSYLMAFENYASLAAASLVAMGIDPARISVVPSDYTRKDRTYESAASLRKWIKETNRTIGAVNVYTTQARARRTLMLFSAALGPSVAIGVVSFVDPSYDPAAWWTSSKGVRTTFGELIACAYVGLMFSPDYQ